ncbi:flagellar basal body P-ring protein FlgI [Aestuariivirga sp.]|uniref:flagellar basal body P-ring protein FlgI n=1 Tax=Aestuariivirga sp. TaxID=2650926 RepID=UPI0039E438EC
MLTILFLLALPVEAATRVKDITAVQGVRDNQLVGYGLVIGLSATGDSLRNSPFTEQSARSMLEKMGVGVPQGAIRSKNMAAVIVTATLPPFIGQGARIDVTVSSLGDASSLAGGTLVLTPLVAADGKAYAVAQGPVAVGGFSAEGAAQTVTQGTPTNGRIANGATIERELTAEFNSAANLVLQVRNPDFTTAVAIADAINIYAVKAYGMMIATAEDFRSVTIRRPPKISASRLMAQLGQIKVEPDTPARIVIDEKTGTIVIGSQVQVSPVAVTHGNLTVRVTESPSVSQPAPLSDGVTKTVPSTSIDFKQEGGAFAVLSGPSLAQLVGGLNRIGLKPQGIIAILQSIKTAGALQADLVVQ